MSTQRITLGMMQGLIEADHCVPLGARVLEQKYCENCTRVFTRSRPLAFRRITLKNNVHQWVVTVRKRGNRDAFTEIEDETKDVFVDTGKRYCDACMRNYLQPVQDADYREELPQEVKMRHSHHLPRYDDSIVPITRQQPQRVTYRAPRRFRQRNSLGDWKLKLTSALQERGPLTARQMVEITGHSLPNPSLALSVYRTAGIRLNPVASVWPRPSCMGQCPRMYQLEPER